MRVVCRHGHFAFYPADKAEVQRFMRVFGLAIYPEEDYFTLDALLDLPRWSQTARPYGAVPAIVDFEGKNAWDVMRENQFVFSLATETLVPLATITASVKLDQTQDCLVAPKPLVQPGSFSLPGVRLLSYQGEIDLKIQRLYIYSREEQLL